MTETTDNIDIGRGVMFYDGHCGACRGGAARFGPMLRRRGFRLMPLQSRLAAEVAGVSERELLREVHLVTPAPRRVLRGFDAILYVAGAIPLARPLRWIAHIPGAAALMKRAYAAFARRRYAISGACGLDAAGIARRDFGGRWMPPILWIVLAAIARSHLPAWGWMWILSLAVYFAFKWITWWPYRFSGGIARRIAYLLGCTSMDAKRFFNAPAPAPPGAWQRFAAATKAAAGAIMIWLVPRLLIARSDLLAGWSAMIGIALLLHFGLFHLLTLWWQKRGVAAEPLMDHPMRAISLADFWGCRWNSGFHDLAHQFIFTPVSPFLGAGAATAIVFFFSGVLHDAIISFPAGGGFGGPTVYFLIQLAGLLTERAGRFRRKIRHPLIRRVYTIAFVVAPLPLLFHPPFVRNIVLPMLHAIGGLS